MVLSPSAALRSEPVALATAAPALPPQAAAPKSPAPQAPAEQAPAAQPAAAQAAAPQDQRVEIAVGRAEAVSFDLAGLLAPRGPPLCTRARVFTSPAAHACGA